MSNEVGRQPLQIVEIEALRCALDYGVSPCTAVLGTTGTRKCYNTLKTCQDVPNYDESSTIKWRFYKPTLNTPPDLFDATGGDIATNAIPSLISVSTAPTQINIAGANSDVNPFGLRASLTVELKDHPWDDRIEDKYLDERSFDPTGTFWTKWLARNPFYQNWVIKVYDGYVGQALADMTSRLYLIERINQPSSDRVSIKAKDPLRLSDEKRAQFPKVTELKLVSGVDASQTAGIIIDGNGTDLTTAYGNTVEDYIRVDDEIISYTGISSVSSGWELNGVVRATLGTVADTHDAGEQMQRVGRYENLESWKIADDLLRNHTPVPNVYLNITAWNTEGDVWLSDSIVSGTVAEPEPVTRLVGELGRDNSFFIWWDERDQEIRMKAIRPLEFSETATELDDNLNIIADTQEIEVRTDDRISAVFLFYDVKDPTLGLEEPDNFRRVRGQIDGEAEAKFGDIVTKRVFSRWIQTETQAFDYVFKTLFAFENPPEILKIRLDAKDRSLWTSDVALINTRIKVDDTGAPLDSLFQVITSEEDDPGHSVVYELQTFGFDGNFSFYMADDAPDYANATVEQLTSGAWYTDENGKINGEEGYLYP